MQATPISSSIQRHEGKDVYSRLQGRQHQARRPLSYHFAAPILAETRRRRAWPWAHPQIDRQIDRRHPNRDLDRQIDLCALCEETRRFSLGNTVEPKEMLDRIGGITASVMSAAVALRVRIRAVHKLQFAATDRRAAPIENWAQLLTTLLMRHRRIRRIANMETRCLCLGPHIR